MQINLKYFGMVAELAGNTEESIEVGSAHDSKYLMALLEKKYNKLSEIDYRLAINESLVDDTVEFKENDTIAILPPFSGG